MRGPLDTNIAAKDALKKREFLTAKPGADPSRGADGTVIFNQQKLSGRRIAPDFSHVAFALANFCQRLHPRLERPLAFDLRAIGRFLLARAQPEQAVDPPIAEGDLHLLYQVDGESRMRIRKPRVRLVRRPPQFYRAPSPESANYAEIGSEVNPDTVVCIIEAMKVMNEIKAEIKGVITQVLVDNAKPVEFGQPLFKIRPI